MIPVSSQKPLHCNGNLYFDTSEEAIVDKQIQNARVIGGYKTERSFAIPGGWDYYEVVFDKNNIANAIIFVFKGVKYNGRRNKNWDET